jgi:chromosome segregation ATPase
MREAFRHWHAEQESLEEQLSESLTALSAYQSHLDAWQERLARERNELSEARARWEQERTAVEAEIEQSRERAMELAAALDEQKQLLESERSKWAQELEQCRVTGTAPQAPAEPVTLAAPRAHKTMSESPVLGSIMEQFGKLRQQRASDRQALKKTTR